MTALANRTLWILLGIGVLASLLVCGAIGAGAMVIGSNEGGWVYPYFWPFTARALWVFAVASAVVFALCAIPADLARRHEWSVVLAWIVGGLIVQGLLRSLTPFAFAQMFASDTANSFYGPTGQYGAATILAEFDRLRGSLPLHAQSNMPGKLLFVAALRQLSESPRVMAWLVVVTSNLGGVLLYLFTRDLFGDRQIARNALALYLFVPSKLFFFPLLNTATPVLAMACAYVLLRGLKTGRVVYPAIFGLILYALVLFEPLPLVMGLLFALLAGRALWRREIGPATVLQHLAAGAIAFVTVYALVVALFQFDLFAAFRRVQADAALFNETAARPYGIWVGANLVEFAIGMGVCQAVLFCGVAADAFRRVAAGRESWSPIVILSLGLLATLLAIDALGINRGEVTRLWIFLACFFQLPAAYACARLRHREAIGLVLGVTLLQCALGSSMIAFIVP